MMRIDEHTQPGGVYVPLHVIFSYITTTTSGLFGPRMSGYQVGLNHTPFFAKNIVVEYVMIFFRIASELAFSIQAFVLNDGFSGLELVRALLRSLSMHAS
jgi:hypothetical protein